MRTAAQLYEDAALKLRHQRQRERERAPSTRLPHPRGGTPKRERREREGEGERAGGRERESERVRERVPHPQRAAARQDKHDRLPGGLRTLSESLARIDDTVYHQVKTGVLALKSLILPQIPQL